MLTEEEIRARVEAADSSRSEARAEAATAIAAHVGRRAQVRAELAEIEAAVAAAVAESSAIMTIAELSAFTGIAETELSPPVEPGNDVTPRRQARRKIAGSRKSRPAVVSASEAPVAVSSDF